MTADSKPRILVVDDSPTALKFAESTLKFAGYEVITSSDLWVAPLLRKVQPNLVLMDVNIVQDGSGAAAVKALKRNRDAAAIPILLYSSRPATELQQLARECGADGYVVKDGDPATLQRAVSRHLKV